MNNHELVPYNILLFCVNRKIQNGHHYKANLTWNPLLKIKNIIKSIISETTEPFDSECRWNVPWMILYRKLTYVLVYKCMWTIGLLDIFSTCL